MTDQKTPDDAAPEGPSAAEAEGTGETTTPEAGTEPVSGSTGSAKGSVSSSGHEEPPYIDEPVSKWWIAAIVAVFALIFAWAIFFGGGGLLSGLFESEDATPSPEPTLVASPSPVASEEASTTPVDASITPTEAPTPEPTAEPTPEPTEAPTPEPTAEPTPEPTEAPTPEPTAEPSPSPSIGPCGSPDPESSLMPGESPEPTPPCFTPEPSEAPSPGPTA